MSVGNKPFDATVVITTKNRKDELVRALQSCITQTAHIEILVIDDGSSDGTAEWVKREFPGVCLERRDLSAGLVVRRNEGARLASADVIISIDDDAEFASPEVITQSLAEFTDTQIAAVAIPVAAPGGDLPKSTFDTCCVTDTFIGTAHAIKRDVFLAVGGYREHLVHHGEEGDLCIRLLNAGYFVRVGASDRIIHHESPQRSFRRMDFYGRRNDVLFVWHNVPALYLGFHLAATTINGSLSAFRTRSLIRMRDMFAGLIHGYVGCLLYFSSRRPVTLRAYRLNRRLKKQGPLALGEAAKYLSLSNNPDLSRPLHRAAR